MSGPREFLLGADASYRDFRFLHLEVVECEDIFNTRGAPALGVLAVTEIFGYCCTGTAAAWSGCNSRTST